MSVKQRVINAVAAIAAVAWLSVLTARSCTPAPDHERALGLNGLGGGPLNGGGAGDITAVTAGTGLTGGATSGPATVNVGTGTGITVNADDVAIDPTYTQRRVSSTCAAGTSIRVIAQDGTVTCETDDDSGGDITSVVAGTGLTGGAVTGAATVDVACGNGLSCAADSIAVNNGTGLTFSGSALTYDSSVIQSRVTGTCSTGWVTAVASDGTVTCSDAHYDLSTDVVWFDDFINSGVNTPIWTFVAAGTNAGCQTSGSSNVGAATRPGIANCTQGTTTTGRFSELAGSNASLSVLFGGGIWKFETSLMFSATSNSTDGYAFQFGFIDQNATVSQVDGCYFEYDERNAAGHNASNVQKLIAVCAKNSTRLAYILDGSTVCDGGFTSVNQTVAAGSLPNTGWHKYKVQTNAAATQVDFYVDDVKSCQITTSADLPNGATNFTGWGYFSLKSVGTTAAPIYIDWNKVSVHLTSAR
jgi:hypothetical protein